MVEKNNSPWFSYTDEHGATISIHIPNLFIRVENMDRKIKELDEKVEYNGKQIVKAFDSLIEKDTMIKDLEAKIAQNRGYTSEMRRIK